MKVKKLKINRIVIALVAIIIIIGASVALVKNINYKKSYDYKLETKGYSESEIVKIKDKFTDSEIEQILKLGYNKEFVSIINEKYFMFKNLEKYLNYQSENSNLKSQEIISMVNVKADTEWYENIEETNTEKEELMLVNKFYSLSSNYEPEDLILISGQYAYEGRYMSQSAYQSLTEMLDAAKAENYTLVVSQGYRSYENQKAAYDNYRSYHSLAEADSYAARPGHSDYQTGLSVLIEPYNKVIEDASSSPENIWLLKNAYKYGFILRYPAEKEKITGFSHEPWRFRYVGKKEATYINTNDITLDEYYAYYES